MYERHYGNKYNRDLSTTEIAKLIRTDIKNAIKAGELPEGLKTSVRSKYFSGGSSIDIHVTACPVPFLNVAWIAHYHEHPNEHIPEFHLPRYTEAGKAILGTLRGIQQAYNHDGSESMVDYYDVKFYGHATFWWELERDVETYFKQQLAAA